MKKTQGKVMSSILYYSNFCEHSKKLIQTLSKSALAKDIHFICIDKRIKDGNNKIYIVLPNEQKIIMPENVTKVPALLLLNQNYKVIYGDDIYKYLRPQAVEDIKEATKNNMEPINFQDGFSSFGGYSGGVVSDNYSFLDQSDLDLNVKGNGGMRQMHNYVALNDSMVFNIPTDNGEYKTDKIKENEISIEALQRKRETEFKNFG